jgi:hypothetical protein
LCPDLGAERSQGVRDGIDHGRGRADSPAFAEALVPAGVGWRRGLDVPVLDLWDLCGGEQQIVDEGRGWASIFRSGSTPVEMLDAMTWININTLYHFPDEFKIQLAWLRQAPPDAIELGWSFSQQLGRLTDLLADGIAAGEIRPGICPMDLLARCVITVQWIPENILTELGTRLALLLARDTVLRGIAVR